MSAERREEESLEMDEMMVDPMVLPLLDRADSIRLQQATSQPSLGGTEQPRTLVRYQTYTL